MLQLFASRGRYGTNRIRLPLGWRESWDLAHYRPGWKAQLIPQLFRTGAQHCFLDVGVNRGQTLLDLLSTGIHTDYVGFEPDPEAVAFVRRWIAENRLPRCTICPVGLSSSNGVVRLFTRAKVAMDASGTVHAELRPTWTDLRTEFVAVVRLDDFWPRYFADKHPDLVKIDVEGAELEVLQGMEKLLAAERPPVICEVLLASPEADMERYEEHLAAVEGLLRRNRYTLYFIRKPRHEQWMEGLDPVAFLRRGRFDGRVAHCCDYLLVPEERAPEVDQLQFAPPKVQRA